MSTITADGFDPYNAWLKVREMRRPLNAYELLGLHPFETDEERIRDAAGQQRAAMELHRDEAHPATWRQVYDELEEAVHVLTNADLKVAYDLALRSRGDGPGQKLPARVPAPTVSPTGESLLACSHCGAGNLSTRKFCSRCGKNLWQPCTQCGTLSVAGEKFCGACGADMLSTLRKRAEQFEGIVDQARALHAADRHQEAIDLLSSALSVEHGYLVSGEAAAARRLLEAIVNESDLEKARAEQVLIQARQEVNERRYAEAVRLLESVRAAFRPPAMQELLDQARTIQTEIEQLCVDLRNPRILARPSQLLAKVKRLLEVQPDDVGAQKLAQKLGTQLFHLARQRILQHRYPEALRLLDEIPAAARSEAVEKTHERAAEIVWLDDQIRMTSVIDSALPKIAARLQRLAPRHPTAERVIAEMKRRMAAAEKHEKFSVPRWAKPPEDSLLGPAVEWLTGFRHISVRDVRTETAFLEHPGCYYAACGLALQGLGQAQLQASLSVAENRSMLARVAKIMPRRAARSAWGIDVGSAAIKAIRLVWNEEGRIAIHKCDYIEHRRLLSQAADELDSRRLIEESLRVLRSRQEFRGDRVCVGLPGGAALHRMVRLPPLPDDKIEAAIQGELKQITNQIKQKLAAAYHVLDKREANNMTTPGRDVVLWVGRHDRLAALQDVFQNVGIAVDLIQSDCLALHNYMSYEHLTQATGNGESRPAEQAVALLDLGGDLANLVITSPHLVWIQSMAMGSDRFTKSLSLDLGITYQEAEQLKRQPHTAPRMSHWHQLLVPVCDDFMLEFKSALELFARLYPEVPVTRIVGVGGGFLLHGLLNHLQRGSQLKSQTVPQPLA